MRRSLAGLASSPRSLSPRRPGSMVAPLGHGTQWPRSCHCRIGTGKPVPASRSRAGTRRRAGPAAHLTHRGVQIHGQLRDGRRGAHRPRPRQRMLGRFVELALPERERPQERPRSRRRHHREGQHRTRRARPQPVRRCSGRPPAVNTLRPAPAPAERPGTVSSIRAPNPTDPSPCQQQPRIGHQRPIIENRPTRRSHLLRCSQEVPPHMARMTALLAAFSHVRRLFLVDAPTPTTWLVHVAWRASAAIARCQRHPSGLSRSARCRSLSRGDLFRWLVHVAWRASAAIALATSLRSLARVAWGDS